MVVIVFRFQRRVDNCHCWPLGMADADSSVPVYGFCKGYGLIINAHACDQGRMKQRVIIRSFKYEVK